MKRYVYGLIVSLCAGLVLTACSARANQAAASQATGAAGGSQGTSAMQLAMGMFKLDSSSYPLDAEQAKTLLPLWKAARALGKSDSTADAEITGLVKQIQTSVTADQLKVIQGMTADDLAKIAQEKGLSIGPTGAPPADLPAGASTASASQAGSMGGPGGMGGPPGMMGGPPGGSSGSSSAKTTQSAASSQSGSFQGVSSAILDAVIQSLQMKTQ